MRPQAKRHRRPQQGNRQEVDAALDQEEGNRAPADPLAGHAAAVKYPGAEGQSAGAARRNQRAHRQLRSADLPASPPAEPGAEDRAEHNYVRAEGQPLQERRKHEPAGTRAFQLVADVAESRGEHKDQNEDRERRDRLERAAAKRPGLKLARELGRRRLNDLVLAGRGSSHAMSLPDSCGLTSLTNEQEDQK